MLTEVAYRQQKVEGKVKLFVFVFKLGKFKQVTCVDVQATKNQVK
jgi:hypothetical protein